MDNEKRIELTDKYTERLFNLLEKYGIDREDFAGFNPFSDFVFDIVAETIETEKRDRTRF